MAGAYRNPVHSPIVSHYETQVTLPCRIMEFGVSWSGQTFVTYISELTVCPDARLVVSYVRSYTLRCAALSHTVMGSSHSWLVPRLRGARQVWVYTHSQMSRQSISVLSAHIKAGLMFYEFPPFVFRVWSLQTVLPARKGPAWRLSCRALGRDRVSGDFTLPV